MNKKKRKEKRKKKKEKRKKKERKKKKVTFRVSLSRAKNQTIFFNLRKNEKM